MRELRFKLNIIDKPSYKIYLFESKLDPQTGESYQPTSYDIHMWKMMTENFLSNCKNQNINFAFIFNLHTISSLPISFIVDICSFFINYNPFFETNLISNCFIFSNDKLKSFIDLFLNYYKPVRPIKILKNMEECINNIAETKLQEK